jgi:hypothetical protein
MNSEIKPTLDIEEIDLKGLSQALANALAEQIGGTFQVRLTKFEHTNRGFSDDKILVNFQLKDESWFERSGVFSRLRHTRENGSE